MTTTDRRFPAEWEPHVATWIGWPHQEEDWPDKLGAIQWVYAEIVRNLVPSERVEIVCFNAEVEKSARQVLTRTGVDLSQVGFHQLETDRGWLRDSGATLVKRGDAREWIQWHFNAWAKYDNYHLDRALPKLMGKHTQVDVTEAVRPDGKGPLVLEGGAIETDGEGTLIVTEECLLSPVQERNPGLSREGYEAAFKEYLGITKTIWLKRGCVGDDTHGHIDDLTRFVAPGVVVTALETNPADENYEPLQENYRILQESKDAKGRPLKVIPLPMPEPIIFDGLQLPASYANFYIGNSVVIVPTFNDVHDRAALSILADAFPEKRIVGIHSVDLVWGFGTLHCLSQQEPK